MSGAFLESKWRCLNCRMVHDEEFEAEECCPVEIREVWICPTCGDVFNDQAEAIACHDFDPEYVPPPSAAELEAAGQLRLVP